MYQDLVNFLPDDSAHDWHMIGTWSDASYRKTLKECHFPTALRAKNRMNRDITGYKTMYIEEYPVWPRQTYIRECEAVDRVMFGTILFTSLFYHLML